MANCNKVLYLSASIIFHANALPARRFFLTTVLINITQVRCPCTRSRPCRSPLLLVPRIIFRANASTLPPLLRTTRPPLLFFSPPSVAPSTRREGLGADDKMLKLSPLQRYFLAFFAPSLEDRWKPLEPFHSSNIALVFQMFVYSRFSR